MILGHETFLSGYSLGLDFYCMQILAPIYDTGFFSWLFCVRFIVALCDITSAVEWALKTK